MKTGSIVKLAVFNVCFAILEVVLFSPALLNVGAKPVPAVIAAALSIGTFFGVNYWLLNNQTPSVQSGDLHDTQDYRDALKSWKNVKNPFNNELDEAMHQLDQYTQKSTALRTLLGSQAKEPGNPYISISKDVEECLFSNMKRLINRMTIIDLNEPSRFPMHYQYIRQLLEQNRQLLTQFENLIIEISQIGDTASPQEPDLETITQALHELRDSSPALQLQEGMNSDLE